jgi:hypothetical protein
LKRKWFIINKEPFIYAEIFGKPFQGINKHKKNHCVPYSFDACIDHKLSFFVDGGDFIKKQTGSLYCSLIPVSKKAYVGKLFYCLENGGLGRVFKEFFYRRFNSYGWTNDIGLPWGIRFYP